MKILNFGSCNIDYVYSVDKIVSPGETTAAESIKLNPGGKGLNQAVALARAGVKVYFAGLVGNDGDELVRFMESNDIDLKYLSRTEEKTGNAFIQVGKNGENSIVLFHGANYRVTKEYVDSVLNDFEKGDYIVLQNEISNIEYVIEKANEKGMIVVLNPSPFDEKMKQIDLDKVTYLILNEVEASCYAGTSVPRKVCEYVRENHPQLKVVLTLGKKGCVYFDADGYGEFPAYEVQAIDSTAAGDTFTGYFIANVSSGKTVDKAIQIANAAAAISVTRRGAAASIPLNDDVKSGLVKFNGLESARNDASIRAVEEYINKNYATATLNDVAAVLNYSASYTVRWLSKNMNTTFSELLSDARCLAAAELLVNSDISIGDVIDKVGYQNESFFRKKFVKKYGVTPLQFRKNGGKFEIEMKVISKKKPLLNFCVKTGCSDIIRTAVEDVNDAIEKITGVRLGVVETENLKSVDGCIIPALFSDNDGFNKWFKKESQYLLGSDGFAVKPFAGNLYVLSHCESGVFYGMHDLLEKNADVIWARGAYDYQTEVLENNNLTFKNYDYAEKSPFVIRVWNTCGTGTDGVDHGDTGMAKHLGRNKINGVYHHCNDEWYNYGLVGQSLASAEFRNIDYLMDEHPEYFMTDEAGVPKKTKELESYINYYNPEVAKVYAKIMVDYINEKCNPNDILGWNMPDAPHFCVVHNGVRLHEQPFVCDNGTIVYPKDENYKSTVYFNFINRLIEEINVLRPNTYIQTQAYMYSEIVPAIKVDDRVMVKIAPLVANEKVAHNDTHVLDNAVTRDNIIKWLKKNKHICINAYWNSFKGNMYSRPIVGVVQQNLRWWRDIGVFGFTPEGKVDCGKLDSYTDEQAFARKFFDMNECYTWIINKLTWNPEEDTEALKRRYCDIVYKESADEMLDYFNAIEKGFNSTQCHVMYSTGADVYIYQCIIKAGVKDAVLGALERAVKKATTPTVISRVNSIYETILEYINRYVDFVKEEAEFAYCKGIDPLSDEQMDFVKNPDSIWNRATPQTVLRNYDDMTFYPKEAKFSRRMLYDDKYLYFGYMVYDDRIVKEEIIDGRIRVFRNDGTEVRSRAETYMGGNALNQDKIFGYVSGFNADNLIDHLYEKVELPIDIEIPKDMRDVKKVYLSDNPEERRYFHVQVVPISIFDISLENFKPYGHFVYYTDRYQRAGWMGFGLWGKQNFTIFTLERRGEENKDEK